MDWQSAGLIVVWSAMGGAVASILWWRALVRARREIAYLHEEWVMARKELFATREKAQPGSREKRSLKEAACPTEAASPMG